MIKASQLDSFGNEINTLNKGELLKGSIQKFLNEENVVRVGGRLKHSNLAYGFKYQMLIHSKQLTTKLIFKAEHIRLMHAGPQLLNLATIHQHYWPVAGINLAKQIVRNCVICFKYKPKSAFDIMGDLPNYRCRFCRPFSIKRS